MMFPTELHERGRRPLKILMTVKIEFKQTKHRRRRRKTSRLCGD